MAQTVATISICLFIVIAQHFYNWSLRKMFDMLGEHGAGLLLALSVTMTLITILLFRLLLIINK
jgi:uncharacterized membrane protein